VIRAKVRRDGPGEWSWTLQDDHGEIVTGLTGSWSAALGEVTDELRLMDEADHPPAFELPIVGGVPTSVRAWRRWLGL
jgi:hypothetical protein